MSKMTGKTKALEEDCREREKARMDTSPIEEIVTK